MIIAKIVQSGQVITLEDALKTFQYSANLQMQFVKDPKYKDYILIGWYRHLRGEEHPLDIDKDGIFTLGPDIFRKNGTVDFSFSLNKADEEIVHLGVIEYTVEQSFGSGDAILPENKDTWIQVVASVVKDQVSDIWDKDYNPQLEENLVQIEAKTEEIKAAVNEVKQNAAESSTNAKSALDSANLAKESADNAKLAEEKALEYSASAEQFKNDAYSYADQANTAKVEASKSAQNASSSAFSALDSANAAKDHLDIIVEKTNAFNTNVENVNTALDTKIADANTNLDKKITDANTNLDAKVTDATEQANIATDKATELSEAVDKVNHLEDVVDTKLTQPYVSSGNIENATIADSDEGLSRNLKIYGKCTQNVEENIVPTPDREVPIISKKIIIDEEVIELRSLKESVNLWDSRLMNYHANNDIEAQVWAKPLCDIKVLNLKPNTTYTCSCTIEMLEKTDSVLTLFDNRKQILLYRTSSNGGAYSGLIADSREDMQNGNTVESRCTFTTPSDLRGLELLIYTERYLDENNKAYFSKVAFKDIMLVEGTTVPSTYVAPTIRDFKIVDHANKKAWIERNVVVENLSNYSDWAWNNDFACINTGSIKSYSICMCNYLNYYKFDGYKNGITVNINKLVCIKDESFNSLEDVRSFLNEKEVLCYAQLENPTVEEIEYLENDTSESGYSFQDNTSPSYGIPSELEPVTELNITACGKNLLPSVYREKDVGGALWTFNRNSLKIKGTSGYKAVDWLTGEELRIVGSSAQIKDFYKNSIMFFYKGNIKINAKTIINNITNNDSSIAITIEVVYDDFKNQIMYMCNRNNVISNGYVVNVEKYIRGVYVKTWYTNIERDYEIHNVQMELGNKATDYEHYKGTSISYVLEEPIFSIGDYVDILDINKKLRENRIYELQKKQMLIDISVYKKMDKCIRFGMFVPQASDHITDSTAVSCNLLKTKVGWGEDAEIIFIHNDPNARKHLYISIKKERLIGYNDNLTNAEIVNLFKEFLNNNAIRVWWVLAEPPVKPLENGLIEKAKQLKTFYPDTNVFSNAPLEFKYKLNMPAWHKVVSGEVENAKDVIYNMQVQQNNLEVMQLQSALETQYNMDLLKLGGNLC